MDDDNDTGDESDRFSDATETLEKEEQNISPQLSALEITSPSDTIEYEDDFGDFGDVEEVDKSVDETRDLERQVEKEEYKLLDVTRLDFNQIESTVRDLFEGPTFNKEEDQDNNTFDFARSKNLWSQLTAPVILNPPDWKRSRTRRLFLVSLGIPIDLDEILPADNKAKKLILPSLANSRQRSSSPSTANIAQLFDKNAARALCQQTPSYLEDSELALHIDKLQKATIGANDALTYWLQKKDEKVTEKETLMVYVDSFVSHAEKQRRSINKSGVGKFNKRPPTPTSTT